MTLELGVALAWLVFSLAAGVGIGGIPGIEGSLGRDGRPGMDGRLGIGGITVGIAVGIKVGMAVGTKVGMAVGTGIFGRPVGNPVGIAVGTQDGSGTDGMGKLGRPGTPGILVGNCCTSASSSATDSGRALRRLKLGGTPRKFCKFLRWGLSISPNEILTSVHA